MNRDLPTLQSLRAVAALAVAAYHIAQWTDHPFYVGQAGVDLFFVISGVVMWLSAVEADAEPVTFLARRALRIAPAYWAATLACVAVAVFLPGLMVHLRPTPGHVALSLAFIPHLDPEGLPFPLLSQGWSLTYEAGFYLVVAGALLAPKAWRMAVIAAVLVGAFVFGLVVHAAYWLGANGMLIQFLAGCALGQAYARRALPSPTMGWALIAVGFAAFAGYALTHFVNELWRPLLWGVPAAMIIAGALSLEQARRAPRLKPLEALGDASYSLYLWHTIAVALLTLAIPDASPFFIPAAFAAALAAAFAGHRLIEAPFHALSRRLKGSKPSPVRLSTPN